MADELSLAVVGLDFLNDDAARSNRRFEVALCRPGDPVTLRREPMNRADPRAVAVYSERGVQIGYLTAERCGLIGNRLDAGARAQAVFQEARKGAAIIRVRMGEGAPQLPPPRPVASAAPAPDFYPDLEGPAWGA